MDRPRAVFLSRSLNGAPLCLEPAGARTFAAKNDRVASPPASRYSEPVFPWGVSSTWAVRLRVPVKRRVPGRRRAGRLCAAPLLAALVLATPRLGWAAQGESSPPPSSPPPSSPAASEAKAQIARDLFERGKEKWSLGQYAEAASLLAASNQQLPRGGTCMLLGDAYERLGRLRTARDTFERAAELARASGDSQLEYRASTRAAALAPRLPQIEVRVQPPLPQGLLVTLNGVELPAGELNQPTALDAGRYHLEVRAPGYRPVTRDIELSNEGQQPLGVRVVPVQLVRGDEADESPSPGDGASRQRALAWWVGGAGAALALGGAVSLLVALDKNSASKGECGLEAGALDGDENACTERGASLRGDARTFAHLATAGTLLGLAGIGAGVTLYVTAGEREAVEAAGVRWSGSF